MDFANAINSKARICLIGNSKLSQIVHSLIGEFESVAQITIIDNIFNDAVRAARDLIDRQQVDIFVSAGANAFYLHDTLPVPVLGLRVSSADLIQATMTAHRISSRILLLTYERQKTNLDVLKVFHDIEIQHCTYATAEEIKEIFHRRRDEGYGVVVGSSYACDLAEQWGMESVLIYSRESCRNLLRKAVRLSGEHKRRRQLMAMSQFLLDQNPHPAVLANLDGTAIAWNAATVQQLPQLARRQRLDAVLDRKLLQEPRFHSERVFLGERLGALSKQPFDVDGQTVGYLYAFTPSPVAKPQDDRRRLVFRSERMAEVENLLAVYGATAGTVLLHGETGTGKELAARYIHAAGANAGGPFVALNCSAVPAELFESELFGYADGAFTSARSGGRSGLLESANRGSFFMDEINSLPLAQQAKLLRVLQEREVTPVGSRQPIALDLRFITACNVDLIEEVRAGRFREDLYYRISTFAIRMPPLRERPEDIAELTSYMVHREVARYAADVDAQALVAGIVPVFRRYHWPGNVRQLENIVERLVVSHRLYRSCEAILAALPRIAPELYALDADAAVGDGHLQQVEQEAITRALDLFGGNRTRAAEYLGISQTTLWRRLKLRGKH